MKITLFSLIFLFIGSSLICQEGLKKGEITLSNGTSFTCFIYVNNWTQNPRKLGFKRNLDSKEETLQIAQITSFEVFDFRKYEKHNVAVDLSSQRFDQLSNDSLGIYIRGDHLLRVLIKGEYNLFQLNVNGNTKYLYSKNLEEPKQLLKKTYINKFGSRSTYNEYLSVLQSINPCFPKSSNTPKYSEKSLIPVFEAYNQCSQKEFISFVQKEKSKPLSIFLRTGLRSNRASSSLSFPGIYNVTFDTEYDPYIGILFEFILPMKNDNICVVYEPTYQSFSGQKETYIISAISAIFDIPDSTISLNYKSIEHHLGLKYKAIRTSNLELYITGQSIFDSPFNRRINSKLSFSYGLGINYKKLNFELRNTSKRKLSGKNNPYGYSAIIMGYKIL